MKSAPQAPYFDSALGVWVLSRFTDVSTALHESELWPVGPNGEGQLEPGDRDSQAKRRAQVLAGLHARKIAEWKSEFAPMADNIAAPLPTDRALDVLGSFARPWSLTLAAKVVGIDAAAAQNLVVLAAKVTAATADPDNSALKTEAAAAGAELDRTFVDSRLPMPGPAFIALSQTLPCLLATAWTILLKQPEEMERMRSNPELMPKAVDELLRLAGLARVLHRRALADVKLGDTFVERGQRVNLMLEIANHDPEQFAHPDRLDLSRRATGHFALGTGEHLCAAAALIRMAVGVATGVFVSRFVSAGKTDSVEWLGGSGFRWPAAVYARRRSE